MRTHRRTILATGLVTVLTVAGITAAIANDPPPRIAFLANGIVPADALAAGPIAGQLGAPIFTTAPDTLVEATSTALTAYAPELVIVMGGPVAISDAVLGQVEDATGLSVVDPAPPPASGIVRAAGADRFETAAAAAELLAAYNPAYLPTDSKAADSELLDGLEPAALSVQGYERVEGPSVILANPGDIDSSDAICPAGKAVIGGGYATQDGTYNVEVFRNYAVDDQTWRITAENISASNDRRVRAYAICAVVNP